MMLSDRELWTLAAESAYNLRAVIESVGIIRYLSGQPALLRRPIPEAAAINETYADVPDCSKRISEEYTGDPAESARAKATDGNDPGQRGSLTARSPSGRYASARQHLAIVVSCHPDVLCPPLGVFFAFGRINVGILGQNAHY
jgi:hypothetical protein